MRQVQHLARSDVGRSEVRSADGQSGRTPVPSVAVDRKRSRRPGRKPAATPQRRKSQRERDHVRDPAQRHPPTDVRGAHLHAPSIGLETPARQHHAPPRAGRADPRDDVRRSFTANVVFSTPIGPLIQTGRTKVRSRCGHTVAATSREGRFGLARRWARKIDDAARTAAA
jgi:hypothetical protein